MAKRDTKLNNAVYHTVREEVIAGKYSGGTFLTEADLCAQFGVSRTPVREALIRLNNERIIQLIPNKGALVPHITIADIIELCQLRIANDGMAAYLSCERQTPELLAAMERSVAREEQMLAAPGADPRKISEEDFVFHDLIVKNCGNRRLIDTSALIQSEMDRIIHLSADEAAPRTLNISVKFHRMTVEAFHEKDCRKARQAIEDHWKAMEEGYIYRSITGHLSPAL